MTDASPFTLKAINAPAFSSHLPSLPSVHAPVRPDHFVPAPSKVEIPDDDGQIHCVCGFTDDDGWTVACDECNRWQHQACYYPEYNDSKLPEELQHYCVECRPRNNLDLDAARQRQVQRRGQIEPLTNGVKRAVSKSHKKKVKEPNAPLHTNGWPAEKFRHDRNSASPRDQPPPAKRPKTAHRTSDSTTTTTTTTTTKGHSRKRNASNVNHRRSLSRSPDSPIEQYSEEFLQCYLEDRWSRTDANLYKSISVSYALGKWLEAPEDEFQHEHNQSKGEVLMRWDGQDVDDIPGKAEIDIVDSQDTTLQYRGQYPTWKSVIVKDPVPPGAYLGELKGHVGFKHDYQLEDGNRWAQLRHPEPFVFFHPRLPIVIDARNEGTDLRYVRRSCMPNARLQVLVTDNVHYHFCFMATQQIEPGEEVAVGWDTADGLPELASRNGIAEDELEILSGWVSTALANCGPCACSRPENECKMSRFDRRTRTQNDDLHAVKPPKSKKRKTGQHISPLNTQVNSRSGSEARRVDPDEEGTDSRSTSGSVGRGSASRDITPNTHYSTNGLSSGVSELSERERKKLAKEEEIFKRQEEEQAGKQAKKKRTSAGSNLNTPNPSSSKQLGFPPTTISKSVDAGMTQQSYLSSKSVVGRKPKLQKELSKPANPAVKRPKPVYVNVAIQCDMDLEEEEKRTPRPSAPRRFVSKRQRLLERCAQNNAIAARQALRATNVFRMREPKSDIVEVDEAPTNAATIPSQASSPRPLPELSTNSNPAPESADQKDVDMADAPGEDEKPPAESDVATKATPNDPVSVSKPSSPVVPSESQSPLKESASSDTESAAPAPPQKPATMHLEMPPPPANPFAAPSSSHTNAVSPNSATVLQSPATAQPIFSPAVTASVINPSPVRKKMSLSDYTSRRKTQVKDHEARTDRESSPASVASGPVVPPLQPSSSAEARAAEGGSAIEEDVKMEDASSSELAAA